MEWFREGVVVMWLGFCEDEETVRDIKATLTENILEAWWDVREEAGPREPTCSARNMVTRPQLEVAMWGDDDRVEVPQVVRDRFSTDDYNSQWQVKLKEFAEEMKLHMKICGAGESTDAPAAGGASGGWGAKTATHSWLNAPGPPHAMFS